MVERRRPELQCRWLFLVWWRPYLYWAVTFVFYNLYLYYEISRNISSKLWSHSQSMKPKTKKKEEKRRRKAQVLDWFKYSARSWLGSGDREGGWSRDVMEAWQRWQSLWNQCSFGQIWDEKMRRNLIRSSSFINSYPVNSCGLYPCNPCSIPRNIYFKYSVLRWVFPQVCRSLTIFYPNITYSDNP